MNKENQEGNIVWSFTKDEAKNLVQILHKAQPLDPHIHHFYNNLLRFLYETMTLEEVEQLLL